MCVALTVCTFPLIWVGGLVTTYEAGMAVPDWPNTYGYNLFLYPLETWLAGPWDLFIEHGHRLLGAAVGVLSIALVIVLWVSEGRAWVKWIAVGALVLVIFQGVLGGLRVIHDERRLGMFHGCVAPLFFSLCVALATFTSRRWMTSLPPCVSPHGARLTRLTGFLTLAAYVQLVLGARLRHFPPSSDQREFQLVLVFHLVMAAAIAVQTAGLAVVALRHERREPALLLPAMVLALLVALQLVLGASTWVTNYGPPAWLRGYAWTENYVVTAGGRWQTLSTTAHAALGSLILVTALLLTLRSLRLHSSGLILALARMRATEVTL